MIPARPLRQLSRLFRTEDTEILRYTETEDAEGYTRQTWTTVGWTKSYGTPLSSREAQVANQMSYRVDGVRCLPVGVDVSPEDRLRVAGKTYDIAGIEEGTEDQMVETVCFVSRRD